MAVPINNNDELASILKAILRKVINDVCDEIKYSLYIRILWDTYLHDGQANRTYVTGYQNWSPSTMMHNDIPGQFYVSEMSSRTWVDDKGNDQPSELASLQFMHAFDWTGLEDFIGGVANTLFYDEDKLEVNENYDFHVDKDLASMFNVSGKVAYKERLPYWDNFMEDLNGSGNSSIKNILKNKFGEHGIKTAV